jgi:ppGpp synthetase/RelA/SpoT-type nucleotidyltranferase
MIALDEVYRARYERILVPAARSLEALLHEYFKGVPRVDRIYARAKDPDRFLEKAARQVEGKPKYTDPLAEIDDSIAGRVIVLYTSDIEPAVERALQYFRVAEKTVREPDGDSEFGYFGLHLLLPLPAEVVPETFDVEEAPRLFELQIRTLFQHAWSEANHDLGYKPGTPLSREQKRNMAYAGAQAWGADEVFERLRVARSRPEAGAESLSVDQ